MKSIWSNGWFFIPVLMFFNAGLALAFFTPYGDEILLLNGFRFEPFNSIFRFMTMLGEIHAFVVAGVLALFWRFRYTLLIALSGLVTIPVVYVIKDAFGADRPITFFRNRGLADFVVTVPGVELNMGQTSFPSGHTMAAFALFTMLTLITTDSNRRWGLVFAVLAVLVGVSRVFLVQHFLADILAGALLGIIVSCLIWQLQRAPFFQQMKWLDGRLMGQ